MEQKKIVCFTGHRTIPQTERAELKRRLRQETVRQIEGGATVFRAGGALGFDTMAAQTVLELREKSSTKELVKEEKIGRYILLKKEWDGSRHYEVYDKKLMRIC